MREVPGGPIPCKGHMVWPQDKILVLPCMLAIREEITIRRLRYYGIDI